ncbi:MAG: hypothetical protein ACHP9Z_26285 [Streptosporangiales bacterium]
MQAIVAIALAPAAMAGTTRFTIGADARCSDGVCGEVSRVVVDPVARAVTHLVVEPKGRQGYAAYGPEQALSWPYSALGGSAGVEGDTVSGVSETVTYDTVPAGEVAARRGERIHATDGEIGQVEGLVIDPAPATSPTCCSRKGTCGAASKWLSGSAP